MTEPIDWDEAFEEAKATLDSMSEDDMKKVVLEEMRIAREFLNGIQFVQISEERKEQIRAVLTITLGNSPVMKQSPDTVALANKVKVIAELFYMVGFQDGFFEQLPKVMTNPYEMYKAR